MSAKKVLIDARALIARGWVQGIYELRTDDGLKFCALGAIHGAESYNPGDSRDAQLTFRNAIPLPIVPWNDTPGRTQAEVLAAFDRAIASCK